MKWENIIVIRNGQAVTDVFSVANVLEKKVTNLTTSISKYVARDPSLLTDKIYEKYYYLGVNNQIQPAFLMNAEGFKKLTNGFHGVASWKIANLRKEYYETMKRMDKLYKEVMEDERTSKSAGVQGDAGAGTDAGGLVNLFKQEDRSSNEAEVQRDNAPSIGGLL